MIYVQATNLHDSEDRVRYGRQLEGTPKRSLALWLFAIVSQSRQMGDATQG